MNVLNIFFWNINKWISIR